MSCQFFHSYHVASSMIAWTSWCWRLGDCSCCTYCEHWKMTWGLQAWRLYLRGDCCAVMSGAGTGVFSQVFMGMTTGQLRRSNLAVDRCGKDGERSAMFGAGTCVGTILFICIASIVSLWTNGIPLVSTSNFCPLAWCGWWETCGICMMWCWKVTVSQMHSTSGWNYHLVASIIKHIDSIEPPQWMGLWFDMDRAFYSWGATGFASKWEDFFCRQLRALLAWFWHV